MTNLRTTTLTLGFLTVFGLSLSTASAHDECVDLLTASRNLERATHLLANDVAREHAHCATVIDATEHLEDLTYNLRIAISRQAPLPRVQASFKHIVADFRSLIGTLRDEGIPPCLERDLLAVRDSMNTVGRFVAWTPDFGHDCEFDHHQYPHPHPQPQHDWHPGHGQGDIGHHVNPGWNQPSLNGPRFQGQQFNPGQFNGPQFNGPFNNAPRGVVGLKLGKVQLQFGIR